MKPVIYIILLIFSGSCNMSKKEDIQDLQNKRSETACLSDSITYKLFTYYSDGSFRKNGYFKDMKKDDVWIEWYEDGSFHRVIKYYDGKYDRSAAYRQLPDFKFESDSLRIGVETRFKAVNLYPEEILTCENGILKKLENDLSFDYSITPTTGDSLYLYYPCMWCKPDENLFDSTKVKNVAMMQSWTYPVYPNISESD